MAIQNNDVFIQVDNETIKLEGQAKEDFLNEVAQRNAETETEKAKAAANAQAKADLLIRLGITAEEAALLLS
jgi:hypothetical protein